MTTAATNLNAKGQNHVKAELARLGLKWDANAVMTEIEEEVDFYRAGIDGCSYETPKGHIFIDVDMVDTAEVEA